MSYDWEYICKFAKNPVGKLLRKPEIQQKYDEFLKQPNLQTNMMQKIFGDVAGYPPLKCYLNEFPYDIVPTVTHVIAWFSPDFDGDKVELLQKKFKTNEYVYFENNANNKSIGFIPHYHVFINGIAGI